MALLRRTFWAEPCMGKSTNWNVLGVDSFTSLYPCEKSDSWEQFYPVFLIHMNKKIRQYKMNTLLVMMMAPLLCYCQNSTGVVFSREEVWEYHPIWTTPRGIAHLRVGCEFHSWWYFKLNIPPKNCRNKARATPPNSTRFTTARNELVRMCNPVPINCLYSWHHKKVTTHHGVIGIGCGAASARWARRSDCA